MSKTLNKPEIVRCIAEKLNARQTEIATVVMIGLEAYAGASAAG